MLQIKLVEKIKTHILCSRTFFWGGGLFEIRAVHEITWKNMVHPDKSRTTI